MYPLLLPFVPKAQPGWGADGRRSCGATKKRLLRPDNIKVMLMVLLLLTLPSLSGSVAHPRCGDDASRHVLTIEAARTDTQHQVANGRTQELRGTLAAWDNLLAPVTPDQGKQYIPCFESCTPCEAEWIHMVNLCAAGVRLIKEHSHANRLICARTPKAGVGGRRLVAAAHNGFEAFVVRLRIFVVAREHEECARW